MAGLCLIFYFVVLLDISVRREPPSREASVDCNSAIRLSFEKVILHYKVIASCAFRATIWLLWKERNTKAFE